MTHMAFPEPRRHQHLNAFTQKFFGGITEHLPRLVVDPHNASTLIDNDDGIRSEPEKDCQSFIQLPQSFLGPLIFSDERGGSLRPRSTKKLLTRIPIGWDSNSRVVWGSFLSPHHRLQIISRALDQDN